MCLHKHNNRTDIQNNPQQRLFERRDLHRLFFFYCSIEIPVIREYSRSRSDGAASSADEADGLTWLQRQQQRLRARRDARLRAARLPLERTIPGRTSASHRLVGFECYGLIKYFYRFNKLRYVFRFDGYTSDTTAFADDDDDFSVPLHIQTLNKSVEPALPNR